MPSQSTAQNNSHEHEHSQDQSTNDASSRSPDWLALGSEAARVVSSLAGLVFLELTQAVAGVPKLIATAMLSLFLGVCTWLSVCVTIAWLIGDWANAASAGLATFTMLQGVALCACYFYKQSLITRMTLPNTQAQIQQLKVALTEMSSQQPNQSE